MAKLLKLLHEKAYRSLAQKPKIKQEDEIYANLPEKQLHEQDYLLATFLNGVWQPRRVVVTRDIIAFALPGDETLIDHIPLSEVVNITEMQGDRTILSKESERDHSSDMNQASKCFQNSFQVGTHEGGYNSGRTYYLQANDNDECLSIISNLQRLVKNAMKRAEKRSAFTKSQKYIRSIYESFAIQSFAALLIFGNFLANIVEAQYVNNLMKDDGSPTHLGSTLRSIDYCFTTLFTVELLINLYSYWLYPFLSNGWSIVDALIVLMSLAAFGPVDLPVSTIRLIRAFRIIRIFGRLRMLKKLVAALTSSLLPMLNAFLILLVIASIYAIMGVTLFNDEAPDQFGVFNKGFITMFGLTAGNTWIDPLPVVLEDGNLNWRAALFTTTYIIISNWIVLQISVAVLLDGFVTASTKMDHEERLKSAEEIKRFELAKNPLEPLLWKLANEYSDDKDLTNRIQRLYQALDHDNSGGLTSKEFCSAIKKLNFKPRIHMSDSDFLSITHDGKLCDDNGGLTPKGFEVLIRQQMAQFTQSKLAHISESRTEGDADFMLYGSLKLIINDLQKLFSMNSEMMECFTHTFADSRAMRGRWSLGQSRQERDGEQFGAPDGTAEAEGLLLSQVRTADDPGLKSACEILESIHAELRELKLLAGKESPWFHQRSSTPDLSCSPAARPWRESLRRPPPPPPDRSGLADPWPRKCLTSGSMSGLECPEAPPSPRATRKRVSAAAQPAQHEPTSPGAAAGGGSQVFVVRSWPPRDPPREPPDSVAALARTLRSFSRSSGQAVQDPRQPCPSTEWKPSPAGPFHRALDLCLVDLWSTSGSPAAQAVQRPSLRADPRSRAFASTSRLDALVRPDRAEPGSSANGLGTPRGGRRCASLGGADGSAPTPGRRSPELLRRHLEASGDAGLRAVEPARPPGDPAGRYLRSRAPG